MPTLATHTGKFCGKLCRRPQADCAICHKILSKGESKGLRSRAPSVADVVRQTVFPRFIAAFSSAKCKGSPFAHRSGRCRFAARQRSQNASAAPRRAAGCGNRNPLNRSLRHRRRRLLPHFGACRVSRQAQRARGAKTAALYYKLVGETGAEPAVFCKIVRIAKTGNALRYNFNKSTIDKTLTR